MAINKYIYTRTSGFNSNVNLKEYLNVLDIYINTMSQGLPWWHRYCKIDKILSLSLPLPCDLNSHRTHRCSQKRSPLSPPSCGILICLDPSSINTKNNWSMALLALLCATSCRRHCDWNLGWVTCRLAYIRTHILLTHGNGTPIPSNSYVLLHM